MHMLKPFLLFAGAALANDDGDCVPDWRARELVTNFEKLFSDGNVNQIKDTITSDFKLYSDSQEFTSPGVTPVFMLASILIEHH